jgi:hypothetical protein
MCCCRIAHGRLESNWPSYPSFGPADLVWVSRTMVPASKSSFSNTAVRIFDVFRQALVDGREPARLVRPSAQGCYNGWMTLVDIRPAFCEKY